MPDFIQLPSIFPLGAILFNFLFFTVAIPIEAYILNYRLRFDKRTSIFYSIFINLFSGVVGWIAFFLIEPRLSTEQRSELINYVFFNRFTQQNIVLPYIFMIALIIFFATFFLKYGLLQVAIFSLREPSESKPEPLPYTQRRSNRRNLRLRLQKTSVFTTTLFANALSYAGILGILLFRGLFPMN
ncbi:filament integrity protein FraC [Calothrix sp. NIES-3974]|uniref:filament integrity protein FraC n=1 Tax=Calothrix sp. NIES-3974 TaxID=2005462 RepID=UPI000B61A44D|nr:filament integrity protein FraC [Calothrix sp. NIES-3974]BAZ07657.1 filament integrity protein [Calothrix sp. NIES-3974]